MRNSILKKSLLAVLILSFLSITVLADDNYEKKVAQNREILNLMKTELSKNLPRKIDPYTTLVAVDINALTLISTYEINTGGKSDESVRKNDMPRMVKAITHGECKRSKVHFENGMALEYRYKNAATKKDIFNIFISLKDCEKYYQ
jgi:hypothetical protein